jgi:hypothetical protein
LGLLKKSRRNSVNWGVKGGKIQKKSIPEAHTAIRLISFDNSGGVLGEILLVDMIVIGNKSGSNRLDIDHDVHAVEDIAKSRSNLLNRSILGDIVSRYTPSGPRTCLFYVTVPGQTLNPLGSIQALNLATKFKSSKPIDSDEYDLDTASVLKLADSVLAASGVVDLDHDEFNTSPPILSPAPRFRSPSPPRVSTPLRGRGASMSPVRAMSPERDLVQMGASGSGKAVPSTAPVQSRASGKVDRTRQAVANRLKSLESEVTRLKAENLELLKQDRRREIYQRVLLNLRVKVDGTRKELNKAQTKVSFMFIFIVYVELGS